LDEYW